MVLCLLFVLCLFCGAILLIYKWENEQKIDKSYAEGNTGRQTYISFNGREYALRKDLDVTLLMGIDKYLVDELAQDEHGEFKQADFLMLLVMDPKTQKCTAIHINRDTMAEISILSDSGRELGTYEAQITLAHTYGREPKTQCRNTVKAVSELFGGIKINHYVSIGMDGLVVLNDIVGGVTVEVLDDFTGIDDTLVQGETVTLRGEQALVYIRTRRGMNDSTNLHRMERQKQYIEALETQLLGKAEYENDFIMSSLMEINSYMVSDCSIEQLSEFGNQLSEYGIADYITLKGEAVEGEQFIEYRVDEEALRELTVTLFCESLSEAE